MALFNRMVFDVGGRTIVLEKYERSYVHIPGKTTLLTEKVIYTCDGNYYMIHKGKIVKLIKTDSEIPPYKVAETSD